MRFNRKTVSVITPPKQQLLTKQEVKTALRIDGTADDNLINLYIDSAVDWAQKYTRLSFINRVLELKMDGFSGADDDSLAALGPGTFHMPVSHFFSASSEIDLPYGPVVSISSIKTTDADNAETTVDSATYELDGPGGRVFLDQGAVWPSNLRDRAAVKVRYTAGYGSDPSQVPAAIRQGVLSHAMHMFNCKGVCDAPESCKAAFDGYRRYDEMGFL